MSSLAYNELENGYSVSTIVLANHPNEYRFETLVFFGETGREVYGTRNNTSELALEVHASLVEAFAKRPAVSPAEFEGYSSTFLGVR